MKQVSENNHLGKLFEPRHVAVIGASSTPGKIGNNVVRNLLLGDFQGRISPVNAGGTAVEGLTGYASLASVPGEIDVAFIVVPAQSSVEALRQCALHGVKFAVIGASGFAELGDDTGRDRQTELLRIAREAGIRLIGPNTNGILSTTDKLALGYNASHAAAMRPGRVSVVSHSGALFDGIARRLAEFGTGLAKFIPVGNEADLDMLDFLEYLIDDPETDIIGLVIEGLGDGSRFRALSARAAKAGKPIVALKIGRSAAGASAALAHSSRLAGSARAYGALFRESGIAVAPTVESLAAICALLVGLPAHISPDDRMICVSSSGAGGALVMDVASERGFPIAGNGDGAWPRQISEAISKLPTAAAIRQPVDLGSLGDWALLSPVFDILNAADMHGPVLAYSHIAAQEKMTKALFEALSARRAAVAAPVLLLAPGGLTELVEAMYREAQVLVFHDTATCFDALAGYYAARLQPAVAEPELPSIEQVRQIDVRAKLRSEAAKHPDVAALSELQSAAILRGMGIRMVPSVVAGQSEPPEFPLVLKALVPGIAHKHHHGLVQVGIRDASALQTALAAMREKAAGLADGKDAELILQPMLPSKAELILGLSSEGPLGTFLVVGFGGVNAEIIDEVMLLPVPVSVETIERRLVNSRIGTVLRALIGGQAEAALRDVVSSLYALQQLSLEQPGIIQSVDINPLLVNEAGGIAVDALVVLAPA